MRVFQHFVKSSFLKYLLNVIKIVTTKYVSSLVPRGLLIQRIYIFFPRKFFREPCKFVRRRGGRKGMDRGFLEITSCAILEKELAEKGKLGSRGGVLRFVENERAPVSRNSEARRCYTTLSFNPWRIKRGLIAIIHRIGPSHKLPISAPFCSILLRETMLYSES